MATPAGALFVHPHPDDESIACGGVIAQACRAGRPVTVLTCTGGEAGDNHGGVDLQGRTLPEVRALELADALAILGGPEHEWLGYRDSGMVGTPENEDPASFHQAPLDEAAGQVADLIRRLRPAVVVSDDELGTYGHPDHVKANRVTARAVALAADAGWGEGEPWRVPRVFHHALGRGRLAAGHNRLLAHGLVSPFGEEEITDPAVVPFGTDDATITTRVDVRALLSVKRAAIHAHASQLSPDSFFLNFPDGAEEEFFGVEEFVLVDGEPEPGIATDLFAGL